MSISTIVTEGYGPGASIALVVLGGYGTPTVPVESTSIPRRFAVTIAPVRAFVVTIEPVRRFRVVGEPDRSYRIAA